MTDQPAITARKVYLAVGMINTDIHAIVSGGGRTHDLPARYGWVQAIYDNRAKYTHLRIEAIDSPYRTGYVLDSVEMARAVFHGKEADCVRLSFSEDATA